jgi:hypothetical protein
MRDNVEMREVNRRYDKRNKWVSSVVLRVGEYDQFGFQEFHLYEH